MDFTHWIILTVSLTSGLFCCLPALLPGRANWYLIWYLFNVFIYVFICIYLNTNMVFKISIDIS